MMTRRHEPLEEAQLRADDFIDQENSFAIKSLSNEETKPEGPQEGDLRMLPEGMILKETSKKNPESDNLVTEPGKDKLPVNILNSDRNQLIADQKPDVTLAKICSESSRMGPEESYCFVFFNSLLMNCKHLPEECNCGVLGLVELSCDLELCMIELQCTLRCSHVGVVT